MFTTLTTNYNDQEASVDQKVFVERLSPGFEDAWSRRLVEFRPMDYPGMDADSFGFWSTEYAVSHVRNRR